MRLLTRSAELSVARWITGSSTPFDQLVMFGPDVFDASARIRFIPDPTAPGQDEDLGSGSPVAPPAFVWPADHRRCFACDVDPHWAGVGAEHAAVDALVAHDQLDVVPARPADPQPLYY